MRRTACGGSRRLPSVVSCASGGSRPPFAVVAERPGVVLGVGVDADALMLGLVVVDELDDGGVGADGEARVGAACEFGVHCTLPEDEPIAVTCVDDRPATLRPEALEDGGAAEVDELVGGVAPAEAVPEVMVRAAVAVPMTVHVPAAKPECVVDPEAEPVSVQVLDAAPEWTA